jgi:two-component system, sensor histidine kinase
MSHGMNGYITKPVNKDVLISEINKHIFRKKMSTQNLMHISSLQ